MPGQEHYTATQTTVLQALDALRQRVMAHETVAATGGYHWGHIGDLNALLSHLQHVGLASFQLADTERE